jgi:EAL domain-containing protein (putative c-di-GMP-specific phosphodiesterase class I)
MAAMLRLSAPLDLLSVRLALAALEQTAGDIAINLSAESLSDFSFHHQLEATLKQKPALCQRLLFEVTEYGVSRQREAFSELALRLKSLRCRIGIDLFSQRFISSDHLASLGLDFIKIDPVYARDIAAHAGNQEFLEGLCTMAHALDIVVIASGVEQADEPALLGRLGFDGMTGPGIKSNQPS